MFIRGLTNSECLDIQDLFIQHYVNKQLPPGGSAELWYGVIIHFIAMCEDDVIPKALVDREQEVIEKGVAQEYFEALLDIVNPPEEMNHAEKFIMLMGATSGERREALRQVLGAIYDIE